MTVKFLVHRIARPSLNDWRRRLSANRRGGIEFYETYLIALRDELIRTSGRPVGSRFIAHVHPPLGVWQFQYRDGWVVYIVQRSSSFWLRLMRRSGIRIIMIGLYDHRPTPEELESLVKSYVASGRGGSAQFRRVPPE